MWWTASRVHVCEATQVCNLLWWAAAQRLIPQAARHLHSTTRGRRRITGKHASKDIYIYIYNLFIYIFIYIYIYIEDKQVTSRQKANVGKIWSLNPAMDRQKIAQNWLKECKNQLLLILRLFCRHDMSSETGLSPSYSLPHEVQVGQVVCACFHKKGGTQTLLAGAKTEGGGGATQVDVE